MSARSLLRSLVVGFGALLVVLAVGLVVLLRPRPLIDYTPHPPPKVDDPLAFRAARLAESEAAGVDEVNAERLVLHRAGGSEVVFLYIHGFSAARGEGELVVDTLAMEWSANTWYLRLPGHGGPGTAMATATPQSYFDTVTDALGMAKRLGDKVVVVSTSTGASLGMWAAATYPDHVDALIMASPLVEYRDPKGNYLLGSVHGQWLAEQILGTERNVRWTIDPEQRKGEHYDRHWTWRYPTKAIVTLDDVRRYATQPETLAEVHQPTLLVYYYKDEAHQDATISVGAARSAFAALNGGTPHPLSRSVAIADGAHVLMSEHVRTDKDAVLTALRDFLREVVGSPPRERALGTPTQPLDQPPG